MEREHSFELVMITLEHFEKKFLMEASEIEAIDDADVEDYFDMMNRFCSMLRHRIAQ
ncbi:hypothetical protein ACFQ88_23620 [Paenibacillus sp. NPDC056579]|uniref:hypothetical protein n=1 Tax=Paenibacillus sp. NPDC056579 TaxID=3345871 RepID=UPI0036A9090E